MSIGTVCSLSLLAQGVAFNIWERVSALPRSGNTFRCPCWTLRLCNTGYELLKYGHPQLVIEADKERDLATEDPNASVRKAMSVISFSAQRYFLSLSTTSPAPYFFLPILISRSVTLPIVQILKHQLFLFSTKPGDNH
jgi:hypothetical protein